MRKILMLAWIGLLRLFRDRANWFFVFLMPIGIIILVGVAFGGEGGPESVGLVGSDPLAGELVDEIDEGLLAVTVYDSQDNLEEAVAAGRETAGVIVPDGAAQSLASGEMIEVGLISPPEGSVAGVRPELGRALGRIATEGSVIGTLTRERGMTRSQAAEALGRAKGLVEPTLVESRAIGEELFPAGASQFYVGAAGMVVLFVFLTGLTGSAYLIQSRQLGVTRRMVSTPTSTGTIVFGEAAARWIIAFFQGVYIVVVTALIFGVAWGDLFAAGVLVALLAAVGGGAAMLVGSLFSNDQQAAGLSVMLGLGLGALGGSMFPLDLFPDTMRTIAHLTPHAWAIDGFNELVYTGVGVTGILPELGVLAGFAVALFGAAGILLSKRLAHG